MQIIARHQVIHSVPGGVFNSRRIKDNLIIALARVITDCAKDVALITASWTHKPKMTIHYPRYAVGAIRAFIDTYDKRWIRVSHGTPPHPIAPKKRRGKGARLHYQKTFRPKTRPRVIGSTGGGKSGVWTHPKVVTHRGIKAREFFDTIAEKRFPDFKAAVRQALTT